MEHRTGRTLYDVISENKLAIIASIIIIVGYFWWEGYRPVPKPDGSGFNIKKAIDSTGKEKYQLEEEYQAEEETKLIDSIGLAEEYFTKSNAMKDSQKAMELLDSAIIMNPTAKYYYFRGKTKIILKDFESAIIDLNLSKELDKNQPYVFDHLGLAKMELCRLSKNKGNCWEAIKDFEEAIRLFEDVEKDDKHVSSSYYNIGLALKEVKEYCTALDKFKLANKSRQHKAYEDEIERLKLLCK